MSVITCKERPILFSAPMVRAILAGTKTQTRRAIKSVPSRMHYGRDIMDWSLSGIHQEEYLEDHQLQVSDRWYMDVQTDVDDHSREVIRCPYGQPGDRLWVRESVRAADLDDFSRAVEYLADGACVRTASAEDIESEAFGRWEKLNSYRSNDAALDGGKTVPPMHMPRWASRIDLEVTGVRVERLNDISTWDAGAEGVNPFENPAGCQAGEETANQAAFRLLWESISGADSWAANPWVWAVEFKRVKP